MYCNIPPGPCALSGTCACNAGYSTLSDNTCGIPTTPWPHYGGQFLSVGIKLRISVGETIGVVIGAVVGFVAIVAVIVGTIAVRARNRRRATLVVCSIKYDLMVG